MRSKIGNAKSTRFSMVTGSIIKPPQLSVHGFRIDISIKGPKHNVRNMIVTQQYAYKEYSEFNFEILDVICHTRKIECVFQTSNHNLKNTNVLPQFHILHASLNFNDNSPEIHNLLHYCM